jgi:hypothetical protein
MYFQVKNFFFIRIQRQANSRFNASINHKDWAVRNNISKKLLPTEISIKILNVLFHHYAITRCHHISASFHSYFKKNQD